MSQYLEKVTKSKEAFRLELRSKPLLEKLAILDRLAERSWMIKGASGDSDAALVNRVLAKRFSKS